MNFIKSKRLPRKYRLSDTARAEAKERRKASNKSHKQLVASILALLDAKGIPATESDTGAVFMGGKPIKRASGRRGWPDVSAIVPPYGRFVGFEAKTGDGVLRPDQKAVKREIEAVGGLYVVARTLQDVLTVLEATK